MSNQNRVRPGVPSGGEFAAHTFPEPTGVTLADPAARPVILAPGEDENFNELADGDIIETIDVHRSHVDDGSGYTVTAGKTLNIRGLFDGQDLAAEGGVDAYLERHGAQIEDYLRTRYDADLDNQDWDEVRVECSTSLPDVPLTEGAVVDAAWVGTKVTALHNESDPGTCGSEFLGRLLREQIAGSASVQNRLSARAEAMRMLPQDIEAHVRDRHLKRELSDAGALAIAGRLKDPSRPALSRFAVRGYADRDELTTELHLAWLQNSTSRPKSSTTSIALDMMRSWIRNGGDNN
ncbi:hypothetical protein [Pseudarthrobacter sp. BIM B-2242]|uniref:hypothetical protein n=1 Tax=Pseudarthrobacter sp. BIM B-2242 TaxID=2772401 RepID=UPI00168B4140|nr:hypothetical protein [Pseudarthrobacter sp. BIM B-2242]QOD06093.1 hypothetical protein IDT60_21260 [Pseudarthrobacter sp. BIM B-2242]